MELTETEKRVLISLHLRGCSGPMGSLNIKQRRQLIYNLIDKGLLDQSLNVTPAGINAAKPDYLKHL